MLNHAYQFSMQKYEVLRINENKPMTENREYMLLKSWWKRRQARNGQVCERRLARPRNVEGKVIIEKQ